jgi:hypothetical protein
VRKSGRDPSVGAIHVPFGDIIAWTFVAEFITGIRSSCKPFYSTQEDFNELQRSSPSSLMAQFLRVV